jgi:hypothetical protein
MYSGRRDGLGCGEGEWMEDLEDRVQWRVLVPPALNLRVLLSACA